MILICIDFWFGPFSVVYNIKGNFLCVEKQLLYPLLFVVSISGINIWLDNSYPANLWCNITEDNSDY